MIDKLNRIRKIPFWLCLLIDVLYGYLMAVHSKRFYNALSADKVMSYTIIHGISYFLPIFLAVFTSARIFRLPKSLNDKSFSKTADMFLDCLSVVVIAFALFYAEAFVYVFLSPPFHG